MLQANAKAFSTEVFMLDYTGIKCPYCDIPFQKDDDVVVCPQCGAPYHRHCYEEAGHCLFTENHETGRTWKAPEPPAAPNPSAEIKDKECPVCGTLNPTSALFCNRCGSPLIGSPDNHQNRAAEADEQPKPPEAGPVFWGGFPGTIPFDLMGGVNPTETLDDSVTFGEASKLVKQNTPYYMPRFRYMKLTGRGKFNLSAFFFGGPWMLYRKMYKRGAVFTVIQFGLYLAYIFLSMFVSGPALLQIMQNAGIDYTQTPGLSSSQILTLSEALMNDRAAYLKVALPMLLLLALLVTMIVAGVTSNKAYMKHSVRTIRQIKAEDGGHGDLNLALEEKGGVNLGIAVCMLVCYMIITNLPTFL